MKPALLVIGDAKINRKSLSLSFAKFVRYARRMQKRGVIELYVIDYAQLLAGRAPQIRAPLIKVAFFFPYTYWNSHIETYRKDTRVYGDKKFGWEFQSFFNRVGRVIVRSYSDKKIQYLNSPQNCYLDRDKLASKCLLRRQDVPTPRDFAVSTFGGIQRLLNSGVNLYLKPRYGAMGKGITYIGREGIFSNFLVRDARIFNRSSDYDWKFRKIEDGKRIVNTLLKKGFICEQAIEPPVFKKRRFDFRAYVLFGKVIYFYAKSSPLKFWVTNWAQGGRIDKRKTILKCFPPAKIAALKRLAKRAARALGVNFVGVDIIFSGDLKQAYVLEGNIFPGHEKGFDLMQCLIKALVK